MANYKIRTSEIDAKRAGTNHIVDFRSDTVTRPSDAMRKAIASAAVGDDVYHDDPTVNQLEQKVAELLGKEAAIFVSSGTQSNLIALLTHCGRGDEYIGGNSYHISYYEAGGAAVLGGISPRHLQVNEFGGLSAKQVQGAINADDPHFARSKLVCLENTFNGMVQDQHEINRIIDVAMVNNLATHLDGARLMNAVVASGKNADRLVERFDTVSLCLSKGLGAPVGSVLAGPADFICRARYNRKLLGGGLRQAGVLAAAGLYALENNIERLADDHCRAKKLAAGLAAIEELSVDLEKVHTNMVFADVAPEHSMGLYEHLLAKGILVDGGGTTVRFVCHYDVDDEAVERLIDETARHFSK